MHRALPVGTHAFGRRCLLATAVAAILPGCANQSTVVLTPSRPSASSTMTITAPERGRHAFTIHHIDTTAFAGGTMDIEVTVSGESATNASFDLFPADAVIPTDGRSTISLATAYDVSKGQTVHLSYTFTRGEIFPFGGEGNWFSPPGSKGTVQYKVTVR